MQRWYVYYRLSESDMPLLVASARAMIDRVRAATGVHGRLLRKCDDPPDTTTLMEVYEAIDDAPRFEQALGQAVAAAPLSAAQRAARRIEKFEDM